MFGIKMSMESTMIVVCLVLILVFTGSLTYFSKDITFLKAGLATSAAGGIPLIILRHRL